MTADSEGFGKFDGGLIPFAHDPGIARLVRCGGLAVVMALVRAEFAAIDALGRRFAPHLGARLALAVGEGEGGDEGHALRRFLRGAEP